MREKKRRDFEEVGGVDGPLSLAVGACGREPPSFFESSRVSFLVPPGNGWPHTWHGGLLASPAWPQRGGGARLPCHVRPCAPPPSPPLPLPTFWLLRTGRAINPLRSPFCPCTRRPAPANKTRPTVCLVWQCCEKNIVMHLEGIKFPPPLNQLPIQRDLDFCNFNLGFF